MYFEAIFQPSDASTYNDNADRIAGKRIAIQDGWVIEEGPYKGQQCYYIPNSTMGQIPASDLKDIRSIPYARWSDLLKMTSGELS
jgi:hypothetical protein